MFMGNSLTNNWNVKTFHVSIWILFFVLIWTLILKSYNSFYLEKKINSLELEKNEIVKNIENIKLDEKVVLYSMIKNNSAYLEKKHYLSRIDMFINTLKELWNTYNIKFRGFYYSNWRIQTKAQSSTDGVNKSFEKIYSFVSYLRDSKDHIFSLSFIDSFQWQDTITFNTVFNLK